MATPQRRDASGLIAQLFAAPEGFSFFQAVRILELNAHARGVAAPLNAIGSDSPPQREVIRFRAALALAFPAAAVSHLVRISDTNDRSEMSVSFFGLTGPSGVLPRHYTIRLLERVRRRDRAMCDFLDLFNHRLVSLFYRAWVKSRLPFALEHAQFNPAGPPDDFTCILYALVGLGTDGLRGRLGVRDESFAYFGAAFANQRRPALGLERLLREYWALPIKVLSFQGRWLQVAPEDQTQVAGVSRTSGRNAQLGTSALLGRRVWDIQSKFRLRVGPLTLEQFRRLLPDGADFRALAEMTRMYVGPALEFDIQLVLKRAEVPGCRLMRNSPDSGRLSRDAWVRNRLHARDVDDAVFNVRAV